MDLIVYTQQASMDLIQIYHHLINVTQRCPIYSLSITKTYEEG
jgi:hypothetical protein